MPRGPRLDAPGALHHVMVRGLNRQVIFRSDADRVDFLARLARVHATTGLMILAWALLPNHVHLLVRTGPAPLARAMRRLLTGYATAFNRRHRRTGHLFQNRYKSILVQDEPYLVELVRYIHLNPLRVGLAADLPALDRFRWTGHQALLGQAVVPWQAVEEVLTQFGRTTRSARRSYRDFVVAGMPLGRRPELQGGGLVRSAGGWAKVEALRRGREAWAADERILGDGEFVNAMRQLAEPALPRDHPVTPADMPGLIARSAAVCGVTPAEVVAGSRRQPAAAARALAACLAVTDLGVPIVRVARTLGVSPPAVRAAVGRGEALLARQQLDRATLLGRTAAQVS